MVVPREQRGTRPINTPMLMGPGLVFTSFGDQLTWQRTCFGYIFARSDGRGQVREAPTQERTTQGRAPPPPRQPRQEGLPGKEKGDVRRVRVGLRQKDRPLDRILEDGYYPEKMTPASANKGLSAQVLRTVGCTEVKVPRRDGGTWAERRVEVPTTEPEGYKQHRESGGKAPGAGAAGTVYARRGKDGPTKEELAKATVAGSRRTGPMYSSPRLRGKQERGNPRNRE